MDSKHCSYQTSPNQRVAKSRLMKNRKIPVRKRMVTLRVLMKTGMTWINAVKGGRRTAVQRSRWLSVFYSYFIFQYIIQNILYLLSVRSCALYQRGKLQWPCGSTWSRPFPRTQCGDWQQGFFFFFFLPFYFHFIHIYLFFQWSSWAVRSTRMKMALMLSWKNTEEVTMPPRTARGPSSNLMFRRNTSKTRWIGELNIQLSVTFLFILGWTAPLRICTVFHLPPDDSWCSWQGGGGRRQRSVKTHHKNCAVEASHS